MRGSNRVGRAYADALLKLIYNIHAPFYGVFLLPTYKYNTYF